MRVLLSVFKYLLLRKTVVLKTCRKCKFVGKKIWRNAVALKSKKVQGIFGKTFILALLPCFGNEVDLRDIMNVSLNIMAENWNFKKLWQGFIDKWGMIKTTLVSSCHWKTLVTFCLRKKRPENAF